MSRSVKARLSQDDRVSMPGPPSQSGDLEVLFAFAAALAFAAKAACYWQVRAMITLVQSFRLWRSV